MYLRRKLEEKIAYFSITFITVLATISNDKNNISWTFEKKVVIGKKRKKFCRGTSVQLVSKTISKSKEARASFFADFKKKFHIPI